MGSSGSGRFSDYPGGGKGQEGDEDRCHHAINVLLEDVEHCEYYRARRNVPPNGTRLRLRRGKRLQAVTTGGEVVGHLPTSANYLAGCMQDGFTYAGAVIASRAGGLAVVVHAHFQPEGR